MTRPWKPITKNARRKRAYKEWFKYTRRDHEGYIYKQSRKNKWWHDDGW